MPGRSPSRHADEVIYCRSYPLDIRSELTYREFVDKNQSWVRQHPEAYVMGDGTLHRATCADVQDLADLDWLLGAHKSALMLIRRAMVDWEGYRKCLDCRPEVDVGGPTD